MAHGVNTPPPPGRERWLWVISVGFGAVSFILSYLSFWTYLSNLTSLPRIVEALYASAQLLLLHVSHAEMVAMSNAAESSLRLEIARLLAVLFMGTTGAALVFRFFGNELIRTVRSRIGKHTVICGLTPSGQRLAREFSRLRDKLVVITNDSIDSAAVVDAMESGAGVLQGNAVDARLLRKIRIHRAANVFLTSEDDSENIRVAQGVIGVVQAELTRGSAGPHIIVQISDPELRASLRLHRAFRADGMARVSMFNVFENNARSLLLNYPLDYTQISENDERGVLIVVIGLGRMGEAVLTRAAMVAHYANLKRLRAFVIDPDAKRKERLFRSRYPHFGEVCDATFIQADAEEPSTRAQIEELCADSQKTIATVVTAFGNGARGLCIGLALADRLGPGVPIRVRSNEESGLAALLTGTVSGSSLPKQITAFGSMREACARKNWLNDELDAMAKVLHKDYVRRQLDSHQAHVDDRNMLPWEQLDDDLIDSNRQLADHIPVKLRAVGCYSVFCGSKDPGIHVKKFTPDQVILMAKMEHQRWMAERFLAGWSSGAKDVDKRRSPYLVEWNEIPPKVQRYDRDFAHVLPEVLATAHREIRQCVGNQNRMS